jgi:hypothetical protein
MAGCPVPVADTTKPVITLLGSPEETAIIGNTYTDAGATARDDVDGDITGTILVTGTVDTGTLGDYIITYNVSDAAGNAAVPVTRTVHVDTHPQYDAGFIDGYNQDNYYWSGYFDSWDTQDDDPVDYKGDTIPRVEDPPYESGYNDGLWYAYHDGYFVAYKYAFILGFSEGYDNAYLPDYLDFLTADEHIEYRNGGFGDGYMDGYSEGRVFGAYDYEAGIDFDWLGPLLDYEDGVDLYFEEIDVGTGLYGPVILYEHGQDPSTLQESPGRGDVESMRLRAIRIADQRKMINIAQLDLYRILTTDAAQALSASPLQSPRSNRALLLTDPWLDRINEYLYAVTKVQSDFLMPGGSTNR